MKKNIWVVIPAYNEEAHIKAVIDKVKKYNSDIVVVDDGSKDSTYESARHEKVITLRHIINLGKGAAMKTGCDYLISRGADIIIAVDADGQHDPSEIPNFIKAIDGVDLVMGYRKFSEKMPFIFRLGNSFINLVTKILFGISIKDSQCGYRAFTAEAYKKLRWRASDYSMESEMIANAGKHHLRYHEIPIETIYSNKYKGTTVLDGVKIVFNMLLWKLRGKNY